jgi:magnesium transporter
VSYFSKRYHTPGTPPGTLVAHEPAGESRLSIHLIDYTESEFAEEELATAELCKPYLEKESITWIHIEGRTDPETISNIGELFGLHPLAMEDVLNLGQRPKIEEYDGQFFIIMALPVINTDGKVTIEQVSLFSDANYLISFHAGAEDPFEPIRKRLRNKGGRSRARKEDYLLYCLLDLIIDQGFPVLEKFGEEIERLEELLLEPSSKTLINDIHHLRRELLLLRRLLWPQREVVNQLLRGDHSRIREETQLYLRDCYDHTVQIMDLIENYRDMAVSMLDVYFSAISNRLNDIMRVLTMIATIFIPLTFITGVYGMNFSNPDSLWAMPELHWYYGYPLVWGIMILIVIGMFIYFKRKNWW